jgi:putative N6-adenine-specific DNA methylase
MRANLWLRTASRVVVRVATFKATAFYELEKRAKKIPWDDFGRGRPLDFRVTAHKSKLYHSDAIAERLRTAGEHATGTGAEGESQLFIVRVVRDEFTISADASGDLLHMRGYRQEIGKAPLRETLAAALLLGAGWTGATPLLDPFCGSGTIPIEGALIARKIAPGIARRFAFMRWAIFHERTWDALVGEAQAGALASSPVEIRGSDRDAGAVSAASANAERAGVSADVHLDVCALSAVAPSDDVGGLVATNPPYGVRIGETRALRDLYARFGQVMRERLPTWSAAMYCPTAKLAAQTGLSWRPLFRTSNGGIRIQALGTQGQFLH